MADLIAEGYGALLASIKARLGNAQYAAFNFSPLVRVIDQHASTVVLQCG